LEPNPPQIGRLVPLGKSAGSERFALTIQRTEIATTKAMVSAAIPPTVSARNGSSIISANAQKQQPFPEIGSGERFALNSPGVDRSPKHPEDGEQVDHSPNNHCLYCKVHG
jgi:hypothetical protein